jgi:thiamine kinase-like enzyme
LIPNPLARKLLLPLLDHLAAAVPRAPETWEGWAIQPVAEAGNNRIYRVSGPERAYAVKFTIRDERDRAGREYETLSLLETLRMDCAPQPVLLERDRYPQPVIVQTWLEGEVSAAPPATDTDWRRLLEHFAAIHEVRPNEVPRPLRPAVLTMTGAPAGLDRIRQQRALIPKDRQPASLRGLIRQAKVTAFSTWPAPALTLCRCDPNILNFVRRPGWWLSVDWENSGWGDPAFEIADLMAHPSYMAVPADRWGWVRETYAALRKDATVITRIRVYYVLTLLWWVARLARSLYEIPIGRDQRLVERPTDWQTDLQAKYETYVGRATTALDALAMDEHTP